MKILLSKFFVIMVKVQPVIKKHAQKSLVLVMKYLSLHSSLDYILIKRKNLLLISLNARVLDGQLRTGVILNHVQDVNSILELESICLWH